jgi:hypothetical protein
MEHLKSSISNVPVGTSLYRNNKKIFMMNIFKNCSFVKKTNKVVHHDDNDN